MRSARVLAAKPRAHLRSARIMPRYVERPAPTSPRRGAWGAVRARSAHTAVAALSARCLCKPRDGGRGGPGARLAQRALNAAKANRLHTLHDRCSRSVQQRARGRSRALPSPGTTVQRRRPGTGRPSPARALRERKRRIATRVSGRSDGTVYSASGGTSRHASASSSISAANASMSARCASLIPFASCGLLSRRVSFAGCVASWI